jgi:hypothetical protein
MWQFEDSADGNRVTYQALRDIAEENSLEADLCFADE